MKVLTIKAIERDFPNQWLLVQEASTSRDEVVRDIASNKDKELFFSSVVLLPPRKRPSRSTISAPVHLHKVRARSHPCPISRQDRNRVYLGGIQKKGGLLTA